MSWPPSSYDIKTQLGFFRVYGQGTITRALQEGQWWDDHLKPALEEARLGGAAIDIGAHFGWFTRYFAMRHPVVYACEPWPPSFALLQINMGEVGHVRTWPVAAYSRPALLIFCDMNDVSDAGSFGFAPAQRGEQVPDHFRHVVAVRLDDYVARSLPITLIKCDAQGADLQALEGLRRTIVTDQPIIVFEWEEGLAQQQGSTWDDYLRFFSEVGYQPPERITTDYWDYVARPK